MATVNRHPLAVIDGAILVFILYAVSNPVTVGITACGIGGGGGIGIGHKVAGIEVRIFVGVDEADL
ncbi:MAG: hypothetical protein HN348_08205 [Proteobacteria bacterium]|nr:hypothetical protein [Pseudomonadota bacterium]